MGSFSIWHWLLVLVVILIVFGAGKLPKVAGDLAAGIKNFRKGMNEGDDKQQASGTNAPAGHVVDGNASAVNQNTANKDKAAQG